jgi:hypothetical protein
MHRIATVVLLALPLMAEQYARADETKVITMSCDGTLTPMYGSNKADDPVLIQKMGVVVNLDEQTVSFLGYVAPVNNVDAATINFGGRRIGNLSISVTGYMDRVTGRMDATVTTSDPTRQPHDPNAVTFHYDLLCKMATRAI